jgi:hypothetical protein
MNNVVFWDVAPFGSCLKRERIASETSILTIRTRRSIPEDDILHSHCRENLKSVIALTGWTL